MLDTSMRLPIAMNLLPRQHCDLTDVPDELAGEMGRLVVAVSAAIEALPSVGRVQLAKYGDGGAHLHLFLFGRPARMLQLRGSPLLDWEENLPAVPREVHRAHASYVAELLVERLRRHRTGLVLRTSEPPGRPGVSTPASGAPNR